MVDLAEAERGVRALHAHYADAVFRRDADAFALCFTADGEWRISGRVFRGRAEIRDAIVTIMAAFERVLISFRHPLLHVDDRAVAGRTYVDERCAWHDGRRHITLGRYYERFMAEEDGRWRFSWRLFQLLYRGDADLTGTFFDQPDYGPPPGMPPLDEATIDVSSVRWSQPPA